MKNHVNLLKLKRWNTPTICNGWEQITQHNAGREGFNLEETTDFMPQMGPMIGYAITVKIEPGNIKHKQKGATVWDDYLAYVASLPEPKIVVVQDLDKPATYGSFWGEVNSNIHRALGCVGTITDGSIRDADVRCRVRCESRRDRRQGTRGIRRSQRERRGRTGRGAGSAGQRRREGQPHQRPRLAGRNHAGACAPRRVPCGARLTVTVARC